MRIDLCRDGKEATILLTDCSALVGSQDQYLKSCDLYAAVHDTENIMRNVFT